MKVFNVHAAAIACIGIMVSAVGSLMFAATLPTYTCKMTKETIQIDGVLNEKIWGQVDTIKFLENNSGAQIASPRQKTSAFVTWDSANLYLAYVTQDNDIKGTLAQRDAPIYTEESVEMFFDSDGDGGTYIELEWNCINTIWDGLIKNSNNTITGTILNWTAAGMTSAVKCRGTPNKSSDVDTGMTVEVKVPWRALDTNMSRHVSLPPKNNDQMRINFYRIDQRTGVASPDLSAWSPTLNGNYHTPSMFGNIAFSTAVPTGAQSGPSAMTVPGFMQSLSVKAVNDVSGTFRISYYVPTQSDVRLTICNAFGQTVKTLEISRQFPGPHEAVWNCSDDSGNQVKTGVYCVNIRANGQSDVSMIKIIR
jgi:hypothetical protein